MFLVFCLWVLVLCCVFWMVGVLGGLCVYPVGLVCVGLRSWVASGLGGGGISCWFWWLLGLEWWVGFGVLWLPVAVCWFG